MKKILLLIVILVLMFFQGSKITLAQENAENDPRNTFSIEPNITKINDSVPSVLITFNNNFTNAPERYICLEQDFCIDNDALRKGIYSATAEDTAKAMNGLGTGDVNERKIERTRITGTTVTVCGDGAQKLKTNCGPNDYFHAGSVYLFSVWVKSEGRYYLKSIGGFPVNHFYPGGEFFNIEKNTWEQAPGFSPGFYVSPGNTTSPFTLGTDGAYGCSTAYIRPKCIPWRINFQAGNLLPGGSVTTRNNYQISVTGPIKQNVCFVAQRGVNMTFNFPNVPATNDPTPYYSHYSDDNQHSLTSLPANGIPTGIYTIELKEQTNDDGWVSNAVGSIGGNCIGGGFTYYRIICKVTDKPFNSSVPLTEQSCQKDINQITDPNHEDFASMIKAQNILGTAGPGNLLPCARNGTVRDPYECKIMHTAIGDIPTDVVGFVTTLLSFFLSLGGLATTAIIVFSGYKLLTSRGDKEKITEARERITSAILGLIFIVLSVFLLSLIGGGILKLPGFG